MELNFDKEMDAILRQTALQETSAPADPTVSRAETHLDADELAAFSANALPNKARVRAMEHLVDCGNCRTILSNLVFFEEREEEKPVTLSVAAPAPSVGEKLSLLERISGFFTVPVMAYGMASLVLVFVGAFALIVWRGNSGADVAQLEMPNMNKPVAAKSAPVQDDAFSNTNATMATSNSAANVTSTGSAANAAIGGAYSPGGPGTTSGFATEPKIKSADEVPAAGLKPVIVDKTQPADSVSQPATRGGEPEVVQPAPPPPPPASVMRQEDNLKLSNQVVLDSAERGQDTQQRNRNMVPDGANKANMDRGRSVNVQAEAGAGATLTRDVREEKTEKAKEKDADAPAPGKNDSKKTASPKKPKKSASPTPTPAAEKKP